MKFPEKINDRENYIFDRVLNGLFDAAWAEISYTAEGKNIKFLVMEDALKIDGVRVNVSATLQQKIADVFGASLMTAQIADVVFLSAERKVGPAPMSISSSTSSMIKHSSNVDAKIKALNVSFGTVADPGKHWILDKKLEQFPGKACNYGWHFVGDSYQGIKGFSAASKFNVLNLKPVKVIQPNATAHDAFHTDYSQVCQLVSQIFWVDGEEKRFSDMLMDPVLSKLVSHQGPLKITRQPGVPEVKGQVVVFPEKV